MNWLDLHALRERYPGIDPMNISYYLALCLLQPDDHKDDSTALARVAMWQATNGGDA